MNHDFGGFLLSGTESFLLFFRCSRLDHDFPGCVICRSGRRCIVSTPLLTAEWNSVNHWQDAPGRLSNLHLGTNSQVGLNKEWFREQASCVTKHGRDRICRVARKNSILSSDGTKFASHSNVFLPYVSTGGAWRVPKGHPPLKQFWPPL